MARVVHGVLFLMVLAFAGNAAAETATYHVTVLELAPPKLAVSALLPIDGDELHMDNTRPGDLAELNDHGWPALVSGLEVSDANGQSLQATAAGPSGWKLARPVNGRLTIRYHVDTSLLAAHGWPAPREAGLSDSTHCVFVGRELFVTTAAMEASEVTFEMPAGWQVTAPWRRRSDRTFTAPSAEDLVANLVALTRSTPDEVNAGGFSLSVVPMGHWEPRRAEVRQALGAVVPRLVSVAGFGDRGQYVVVLLPTLEQGGESFRGSFAGTIEEPPSAANRFWWGNIIAHEIFHQWNGWKLQGADYPSSQWFHEGFTEYAANWSMVASHLDTPEDFNRRLSTHVVNSRRMTTSLEEGGSHKGPPLYSAGALVAFTWDVRIRKATHGTRGLGDFFRALWKQTGQGARPYEWRDIQFALEATAPGDWAGFHAAYIQGTKPLPLGAVLSQVGLRLAQAEGEPPRVEIDATAPESARSLWRNLVMAR